MERIGLPHLSEAIPSIGVVSPPRARRPSARARRRRLVVLVTAIGAFAAGVAVAAVRQDGEIRRAAADRLPNPLLAGQRIVFGFDGT